MKIRALKDSPLCKAGEIFESNDNLYDSFNLSGNVIGKEIICKWMSEGWFEEVKETLGDKLLKASNKYGFSYNINYVCDVVQAYVLEIFDKSNAEYDKSRMNTGKANYIRQKLEEGLR